MFFAFWFFVRHVRWSKASLWFIIDSSQCFKVDCNYTIAHVWDLYTLCDYPFTKKIFSASIRTKAKMYRTLRSFLLLCFWTRQTWRNKTPAYKNDELELLNGRKNNNSIINDKHFFLKLDFSIQPRDLTNDLLLLIWRRLFQIFITRQAFLKRGRKIFFILPNS